MYHTTGQNSIANSVQLLLLFLEKAEKMSTNNIQMQMQITRPLPDAAALMPVKMSNLINIASLTAASATVCQSSCGSGTF